jgi:predicted patatin/cPLA2 family phospholipase
MYNKTMELIERLEEDGRITVIRPSRPIEVSRMEKDTSKLTALYQEGYEIAERMITPKK